MQLDRYPTDKHPTDKHDTKGQSMRQLPQRKSLTMKTSFLEKKHVAFYLEFSSMQDYG